VQASAEYFGSRIQLFCFGHLNHDPVELVIVGFREFVEASELLITTRPFHHDLPFPSCFDDASDTSFVLTKCPVLEPHKHGLNRNVKYCHYKHLRPFSSKPWGWHWFFWGHLLLEPNTIELIYCPIGVDLAEKLRSDICTYYANLYPVFFRYLLKTAPETRGRLYRRNNHLETPTSLLNT
jgi:hypothetical protein